MTWETKSEAPSAYIDQELFPWRILDETGEFFVIAEDGVTLVLQEVAGESAWADSAGSLGTWSDA